MDVYEMFEKKKTAKKKRNREEGVTQKAILNYLQILENQGEAYVMRTGSARVRTESGSYFTTGKVGCADITMLYLGKYVSIEVKSKKGTQKEKQKDAQKKIEKAGGYYFIARSVDDVMKNLREIRNETLH